MILVTRMDKQQMFLNPDHIISIEETPDTVIALFNGHHFIVTESATVIVGRIVAFRARIIRRSGSIHGGKNRQRGKQSLFKRVALNHELICPGKQEEHIRSPFHYRDN